MYDDDNNDIFNDESVIVTTDSMAHRICRELHIDFYKITEQKVTTVIKNGQSIPRRYTLGPKWLQDTITMESTYRRRGSIRRPIMTDRKKAALDKLRSKKDTGLPRFYR